MTPFKIIFLFICVFFLSNCKPDSKIHKEVFVLQFTNDSLLNLNKQQKIELDFIETDSFLLIKETLVKNTDSIHIYKQNNHFVRRKGCIYERQLVRSLDKINPVANADGTHTILPVDSTTNLCFCNQKKDTVFISLYDTKNINQLQGLYNYWYRIQQLNHNLFVTYLGHCQDYRYGRFFFYDKQYNLIKIIKVGRGKYWEYINVKNKNDDLFIKNFFLLYGSISKLG